MENWNFRKIEHGNDWQHEPSLAESYLWKNWKILQRERMKVFCHCCQEKRPDLALDFETKISRQSAL